MDIKHAIAVFCHCMSSCASACFALCKWNGNYATALPATEI